MNLLQLLMGTLTTQNSVDTVSKKTGVSSSLTTGLLAAAVPILISYLTKNASSKKGASSLASALTQHTSTATVSQQLAEADTDDGALIIQHILGNDKNKVVRNLVNQTGLTSSQVNTTLNTIAPYLLSSLSNATTSAVQQTTTKKTTPVATTTTKKSSGVDLSDGFDLSDVMSLLGGGATQTQTLQQQTVQQQSSPLGGLGSLLGSLISTDTSAKTQTTTRKVQQTTKKAQQQTSQGLDLNSVLSLLGGTTNTQTTQSSIDGSDLLGVLTSLMK